jgi:hypothetical protein
MMMPELGTATPVPDVARQAAASVVLPVNDPVFGPSSSQNRWGLVPVGYPVWLWASGGQTAVTQTVSKDGLEVAVTAIWQRVVFTMGDGGTVSCTSFVERPVHLSDPMAVSPSCGYVYQSAGSFTITATSTWLVGWWADGQSGSFTVSDKADVAAPVLVGELSSVIVGGQAGPR